MKICFISTMQSSPWGGSEELWAAAARTALEDGHQVAVAVKRWPKLANPIVDLQSLGVRLFLRPGDMSSRFSRAFERFVYPMPSLSRWKPDVVCVSLASLCSVMNIRRLVHGIGAPYVAIVQQAEDRQAPPVLSIDLNFRHRMISFYRDAACVAFVAEENRKSAERQMAVSLPNTCIVRNPVNLDGLEAVPWPSPGEVRLACVARLLVRDKGQDVLFEVLGGRGWISRNWHLRLYGEGIDREYLKDLARHFGIENRVEFRGHINDIRSVWSDNHLLLLPSRIEGSPLTLVEAMICGRPSVVTDVGGNPEWVSEPSTGFVADASSPRSFGAALERAWSAMGDWKTIGARAHDQALGMVERDPGRTLLDLLSTCVSRSVFPKHKVLLR